MATSCAAEHSPSPPGYRSSFTALPSSSRSPPVTIARPVSARRAQREEEGEEQGEREEGYSPSPSPRSPPLLHPSAAPRVPPISIARPVPSRELKGKPSEKVERGETSDEEEGEEVGEGTAGEKCEGEEGSEEEEGSAAAIVRAAAARISLPAERVLQSLEEAQISRDWQLPELSASDWSELGASLGLVSAVRKVLVEKQLLPSHDLKPSEEPSGARHSSMKNLDTGEFVNDNQERAVEWSVGERGGER